MSGERYGLSIADYEAACRHDARESSELTAEQRAMWVENANAVYAPKPDTIRKFDTGATRSPDAGRYDPEGFFSPLVFERFCEYMQSHRLQTDGTLRASDNWQKGLPKSTYMKGMWRHFLHLWKRHRGWHVNDRLAGKDTEEDLCALLFNVQGYLHEVLKQQEHLVVESMQTADTRRG